MDDAPWDNEVKSSRRLPHGDPKRPPFRPDPNFQPICYELPIKLVRPEWLWSEEDLKGEPREEPGLFLSYRESGRSHTIVWAHEKQWAQWKNVSLFGDKNPHIPWAIDRSKIDEWDHQKFCEQLQFEADWNAGKQFEWDCIYYVDADYPEGSPRPLESFFKAVPEFSDRALKIWTTVERLREEGEFNFGFLSKKSLQ